MLNHLLRLFQLNYLAQVNCGGFPKVCCWKPPSTGGDRCSDYYCQEASFARPPVLL